MVWNTYSSSIVCLTKIAIDTTSAGRIHDATIFLFHHIRVSRFGDFVGAAQMDIDDIIP